MPCKREEQNICSPIWADPPKTNLFLTFLAFHHHQHHQNLAGLGCGKRRQRCAEGRAGLKTYALFYFKYFWIPFLCLIFNTFENLFVYLICCLKVWVCWTFLKVFFFKCVFWKCILLNVYLRKCVFVKCAVRKSALWSIFVNNVFSKSIFFKLVVFWGEGQYFDKQIFLLVADLTQWRLELRTRNHKVRIWIKTRIVMLTMTMLTVLMFAGKQC